MTRTETTEPTVDAVRRMRILEGAKQAFLAYGFQRTTMDDIARAAEISRPALYLMFRNKTDIYRALAAGHTEEMIHTASAALSGEGSLSDRLEKSFNCILTMAAEIEASPHGHELLDMKNSLAGEIIVAWRGRMVDLVEAAIEREMAKRPSGRPSDAAARMLAEMLLDAMEGLKARQLPLEDQRETTKAFIRVVAEAAER
ncbi:MAG: helix-turn-helix domain-containing protein [Rhizobiaceae bacterium]